MTVVDRASCFWIDLASRIASIRRSKVKLVKFRVGKVSLLLLYGPTRANSVTKYHVLSQKTCENGRGLEDISDWQTKVVLECAEDL